RSSDLRRPVNRLDVRTPRRAEWRSDLRGEHEEVLPPRGERRGTNRGSGNIDVGGGRRRLDRRHLDEGVVDARVRFPVLRVDVVCGLDVRGKDSGDEAARRYGAELDDKPAHVR